MITILIKLIKSKYILPAIGTIAVLIALSIFVYKIDKKGYDRCADEHKVQVAEQVKTELETVKKQIVKTEKVRHEVRKATKDIVAGDLPPYTSAVLDCLRNGSSNCGTMQSSTSAKRQ